MIWKPAGVIGGAMTPFRDDGKIDWESFSRHLHGLAESSLAGILINASMAEGAHLSPGERDEVLTFAIREVGNEIPIIATVYGANTTEAADEASRAARLGAVALLVYPHPAFAGEPLDPAIPADYFSAIWAGGELPVIVFRTPSSLAPTFGLDVLRRLSETRGVVAIKDSTGDLAFYAGEGREFLSADSPLALLVDFDPLILTFLRAGAHGATVISSVVDPHRYVKLFESQQSSVADELLGQLVQFSRVVYEPPFRDFRARLKEALRLDGVFATAHVRRPLPPLSSAERNRIAAALEASRGST